MYTIIKSNWVCETCRITMEHSEQVTGDVLDTGCEFFGAGFISAGQINPLSEQTSSHDGQTRVP